MKKIELINIPEGQWVSLSLGEQSREVGVMHGVTYGGLHKSYSDIIKLNNLFPITLRSKILGSQYFEGLMENYMKRFSYDTWQSTSYSSPHLVWVMSDFEDPGVAGLLIIADEVSKLLPLPKNQTFVDKIKSLNKMLTALRSEHPPKDLTSLTRNARPCSSEVRHAMKELIRVAPLTEDERDRSTFSYVPQEIINIATVNYTTTKHHTPVIVIPQIQNPLVSSLRSVQIATGAYYKMELILSDMPFNPTDMRPFYMNFE